MKRQIQRIISFLLVVVLIAGLIPVPAFATEQADGSGAEESHLTYVSLGGSNVNGYGLRGYINAVDGMTIDETYDAAALDSSIKDNANVLGYTAEAPGGYPVLVADELGYDLEQLAISSMRVEELRILLDNDYYGDSYSEWRFVGSGKWFEIATEGGIDTLRTEYQAKIADADLITVDIGANNFGVYISHQLTSNYRYDEDISLIDPDIAQVYGAAKAYIQDIVVEYAPEFSDMILGMEQLMDTMIYALVGFCVNFDIVMEKIYELNPNATVVTVSIQNLMEGYKIAVPGVKGALPLGEIFGALVNAANIYIASGSPYSDSYYCADVRQNGRVECFLEDISAYNGDPTSLSAEVIDCFNVLDGSPGNGYDRNLHVKYMLYKYILTTLLSEVDETYLAAMMECFVVSSADKLASKLLAASKNDFSNIDDANVKLLCQNVYDAYEVYLSENAVVVSAMLNAAYDAVASMLQAAAQVEVIDLVVLTGAGDAEDAFENAFAAQIMAAAMGVLEGKYDYVLPENFFATVAEAAGVSVSAVESVAALYVRTDIGNTFFGHPNRNGHRTVADAVLSALENGTTGGEILEQEMIVTVREAFDFVYQYALTNGYIDLAEELKPIVDKLKNNIHDALHGEVLINCGRELRYAYIGTDYADDIENAIVGEDVEQIIAADKAEADLVTADYNGDEFINYMLTQIMDMVGELLDDEIKRNDVEILLTFEDVNAMIAAYGIDLAAEYTAPDWSGFGADAVAVKDEILVIIENIIAEQLVTQGVGDSVSIVIEKLVPEYTSLIDDDLAIVIPVRALLTKVAENVLYGYFTFITEFSAELDAIHAANPDAQIVITGLENNVVAALPEFITQIVDMSAYNEYIDYIVYALNLHLFAYAALNYDTTFVEDAANIADALSFVAEDHDYCIYEEHSGEQHKVVCSNDAEHYYIEAHTYADEQDTVCDLCGHEKTDTNPGTGTPVVLPGISGGSDDSDGSNEPAAWSCDGGAQCSSCIFEDLTEAINTNDNIWWHEAADYVIKNDLMNGMTDTMFMPNYTTTRAMLVTILWREEGSPVVNYAMPFEDVETDAWYAEAVRWAASNGVVDGMSDTEFAPNANITREQMVTIFYRYAKNNGVNVNKGNTNLVTTFADANEISAWAYDALEWACGIKFIEGKENNNIDPAGNAIRAEMATLIMRFVEKVL